MQCTEDQLAIGVVLRDLASGHRIAETHWFNLLGADATVVNQLASSFRDCSSIPLETTDLIVHNALNLYLNGLALSPENWKALGVSRAEVEAAFERRRHSV